MFASNKKLAQQTAHRIISGHFTLVAWWALKHAGVFDAMIKMEAENKEGLHPLVHAARTNMAPEVLDALLDYLATTELITLKEGQAWLTADAKALLEHEDGVLELVHAYQPILDMAEHMLARLKTSGAGTGGGPVHRKSDALMDSQAKRYAAEVYPAVLALLNKRGFGHLLDLSCGAGDLLMHLAGNSKNIVGVGIGMDGPGVRRANAAISERGLEKRLIAAAANPAEVCTDTDRTFTRIGLSRQLWDELDCLIAPLLFSEMAARESEAPPANAGGVFVGVPGASGGAGAGSIVRVLASIPRKFPKAHLLVIEPTSNPKFEKNYYAPELSLMLRLSKSTPLAADKWRERFADAKLRVLEELDLATDGLTIFLCRPA